MTLDLLRKSLQILIKKLLELSGSLNLKNLLIHIIFRPNDNIMKRMKQRQCKLQMEIMEMLIQMRNDLKKKLQVIVMEMAAFRKNSQEAGSFLEVDAQPGAEKSNLSCHC